MSQGRQVGTCRAGDLIGEVTVLSGEQASATVILTGPARFWCAPGQRACAPISTPMTKCATRSSTASPLALKSKLRASNRTIAEADAAAA